MQNPNMPLKNRRHLILGFLCLGLFVALCLFEEFGSFREIDFFLTNAFQSIIPRSFDAPLSFFSLFGSLEFTTFLLLVLAIFLFKKEKLIPYSLALFALIMVIELIGKFHIYHPSPPKEFFRYALPFSTPHYIAESYSFPSGHAARTTFIILVAALLIWKYVKEKNLRVILVGAIIFFLIGMAISRVYLGEHWSSDVLGGLLLGGAFGFLAMVYYPK